MLQHSGSFRAWEPKSHSAGDDAAEITAGKCESWGGVMKLERGEKASQNVELVF